MTDKNTKQTIVDIAAHFGGIPKLAKALGIHVQAIYQWNTIPPTRAYQIQVLTRGKFKAEELIVKRS